MDLMAIVWVGAALVVVWGAFVVFPKPRTVRDYQRGLLYEYGKLRKEVGAGRYWLWPYSDELVVIDTRRQQVAVTGQEVLTRDRVPLKLGLMAYYSVADAQKALSVATDYEQQLYSHIQLAVRESVTQRDLDDALSDRGVLGAEVKSGVEPMAEELGLELHDVQVRDYMMAGALKNAYSDVILAKQQGLAALERARGESAALRNLANSAQLLESHPGLVKLRVLQALESGSDARVIVSLDGTATPGSTAVGDP